jgi:hypothetical protein
MPTAARSLTRPAGLALRAKAPPFVCLAPLGSRPAREHPFDFAQGRLCAADVGETAADLAAIPARLGAPTAALADCGYADKAVLERLGRERPGLDLYISVHREDAHAERRYDWRPLDKIKAPKTPTDPVLLAMAEKLRTPAGKARYRRRACTVEPVFGIIKSALGFRQFMLRGLKKVSGEWNLVCLAYNLKRLHTLRQGALEA